MVDYACTFVLFIRKRIVRLSNGISDHEARQLQYPLRSASSRPGPDSALFQKAHEVQRNLVAGKQPLRITRSWASRKHRRPWLFCFALPSFSRKTATAMSVCIRLAHGCFAFAAVCSVFSKEGYSHGYYSLCISRRGRFGAHS